MPNRAQSDKRYELSPEAFAWLVQRNPAWAKADGSPCVDRIARAANINAVTLLRMKKRTQELNQRVMAALVGASGAPRAVAERALFEIVDIQAAAEAREMAEAA